MTHDEADHGLDAWGVVTGIRPLFFTVGYGREPLFDYATAVLMSFLGPTYLAGRLTAVFFSLIYLAANYTWQKRAFNSRIAWLSNAGLAVSFWGVMSSRQALRTITLPALFCLALALFWYGVGRLQNQSGEEGFVAENERWYQEWGGWVLLGVVLGGTIYTYIPGRWLWLILPLTAVYWWWRRWPSRYALLKYLTMSLLVALVVAAPLVFYLATHAEAASRVGQLSGALTAVRGGDWGPLWHNVKGSLLLLSWQGDSTWRYNWSGMPFLPWWWSLLFYPGVGLAMWRLRKGVDIKWEGGGYWQALCLLALGWAPSLATGPDLSMTQAIGLQPVLFLFPAISLSVLIERWPERMIWWRWIIIGLIGGTAGHTSYVYFGQWGVAPEVRVQYESSLVALLAAAEGGEGVTAVSTTTPGRFHSPAVALMYSSTAPDLSQWRWFDGRNSLLIPEEGQLGLTGFAPLTPILADYLPAGEVEIIEQPESDLDRPLALYLLVVGSQIQVMEQMTALAYDEWWCVPPHICLLGYEWHVADWVGGETAVLVTAWGTDKAWPTELVLFTQLLDERGEVVAQMDLLGVPSTGWGANDLMLQQHSLSLPSDLPPGRYQPIVGLYEAAGWERLQWYQNEVAVGDHIRLPAVEVTE